MHSKVITCLEINLFPAFGMSVVSLLVLKVQMYQCQHWLVVSKNTGWGIEDVMPVLFV